MLELASLPGYVAKLWKIGAAEVGDASGASPASGEHPQAAESVGIDDTAERCMQIVTDHRIRHLPVVQGGNVVGVVSIGDLVKARLDEIQHEAEAMREYIRTA